MYLEEYTSKTSLYKAKTFRTTHGKYMRERFKL